MRIEQMPQVQPMPRDTTETLVPDDLWGLIAPLLPPRAPHRQAGRPWLSARHALGGMIVVLKTGCCRNRLRRESYEGW